MATNVANLDTAKKQTFNQLQSQIAKNQSNLVKTKSGVVSAAKLPPKSTMTPVAKTSVIKSLQDKAKTDPSLNTTLAKLQGQSKVPLKKSDLLKLKGNLSPTQKTSFGLLGDSVSNKTDQTLVSLANVNNKSTTPAEKQVLDKYLKDGPGAMSPSDIKTLQNMLSKDEKGKSTPGSIAAGGAIAQVLSSIRNNQNSQSVIPGGLPGGGAGGGGGSGGPGLVSGLLAGNLLGLLYSGGGVLGYPGGDGFVGGGGIPFDGGGNLGGGGDFGGGGDYMPPLTQTAFYPSNPSNYSYDPQDPDLYPTGSGVALAVSSEPSYLTGDVGGGGGGSELPPLPNSSDVVLVSAVDTPCDLAAAAYNAAPIQTTRFVRIGNNTNEQVTVHLRYLIDSGNGEPLWSPASPSDASDQWAQYTLAPGEAADVMDGEWRVNTTRLVVWTESPTRTWDQFKANELNLVPDQTYQSESPQVFNYTVQ